MAFSQRVEVIIGVVAEKAKAAVKSFRDSVAEAEGFTGKFKAAAGRAFSYVTDHAGQLAMAGGAAAVAFAVKSVQAFEQTAKAAINLGAATGLAVEDASRWIAVGDDFQVTAENLTAGIGKIAKSLDSGKWEQYGVATRDASGHVRNANDVLIDALAMLSSVKNETDRARIGNDLFGKGYANLAPLIGHTADEYRDMLGAVEDGQVVTDEEAAKAERLRLAQDALSDALHELSLSFGQSLAEAAPFIEALAKGVGVVTGFRDAVKSGIEWLVKSDIEVPKVTGRLVEYHDAAKEAALAAQELEDRIASLSTEVDEAGHSASETSTKTADLEENTRDYSAAANAAEGATRDLDDAYRTLLGHIDQREAWRNVTESLETLHQKVTDGESSWRDLEAASDGAVRSVADYILGLDGVPEETKTRLLTELDQGHFNAVLLQLNSLREDINVRVKVAGPGTLGYEKKATGGPTQAGRPYIVGDNADGSINSTSEIVVPGAGAVHSARDTQDILRGLQSGGDGVTINFGGVTITSGEDADGFARHLSMVLAVPK